MHLETDTRCCQDDHTSTSSSEGSDGLQNEDRKQIQTSSVPKITSLDQSSNPEKIDCKIPIIIEKELIQPYQLNPDVTFLEVIIKGLKNQRANGSNDLDELIRNDPSKHLVLDWIEAFLKVKMQPKIQSKFGSGSTVAVSNKKQENQLVAYSNMNSYGSSYKSSSATNSTYFSTSADTGLLHRVWHKGLPHFQFSIEGSDSVFIVNPTKVKKSQNNLAMDYVYLFHEFENAKKDPTTSRFVGNMRVSSSFVLNPNGTGCMETEFVLFGSKEDYDQEMQNPSSSQAKNKGLIRKVAEMLMPSLSPLPRYAHKTSKSLLCDTSLIQGEISGNKQSGYTRSIICGNFPTNHELATIIVSDNKNCNKKQEPVINGGWGLKFLQKTETVKNSPSRRKINVLVPKGYHGGPLGPSVGPASLKERWSSGVCDCGGWDSGCPITVFCNKNGMDGPSHGEAEVHENDTEDLFVEGVRHDEPALKLVTLSENAFMVHFQSNLSILQCFSIAVAILHARTPDLYPKL